ncbi:MAG TPA: hypothetical protein PKA19_16615 [Bacillota bacterium]|nr:hypothetical protein [Bacillota bacterium]
MMTFPAFLRPYTLALLSLAAILLFVFSLWRAFKHRLHYNAAFSRIRHGQPKYRSIAKKLLVKKSACREAETNKVAPPTADTPVLKDVQDEERDEEDDEIRLGIDNLFPLRKRRRK